MRKKLSAYKPAASARTHLLLAAVMWTTVGSALLLVGVRWMRAADISFMVVTIAVAAGVLKSRLILVRTARRTIDRICHRGDGRCIGGFLSVSSWLLVLVMAGAGRLLRGSHLPKGVVAFVYVVVGTALLLTSAILWRAWYCRSRGSSSD